MEAIRVRQTVDAHGTLIFRNLPFREGQPIEAIFLPDDSSDDVLSAVLRNDPAWSFLKDNAEDLYSDEDLQER